MTASPRATGPAPESNWRYRRLYTYAATLLSLGLIAAVILQMDDQRALMWLAIALVARDAWRETLYIVAPSAQAIVQAIDAWKGRAS